MKATSQCRTPGESRAYQRGYNTGRAGQWPRELAATVPDARVAALVKAAADLEGRADAFMACFDDRDTQPEMLALDRARDVLRHAIEHLHEPPDQEAPPP